LPGYEDWYEYDDIGVKNGFRYVYAVTAFDRGDPALGLESLESAKSQNAVTIYPGTPASPQLTRKVKVYPNPYVKHSVWDKPGDPFGRVIRFYNLPEKCVIYIFTMNGELVKTIRHDNPLLGEETWNLITDKEQDAASGLYYFVVKDLKTGKIQRGQFVIIK
jgi:hypothetical protein